MRTHSFALAGGLALLVALPLAWFAARQKPLVLATTHGNAETSDYKISGPYTHKNLSIFLLHAKDAKAGAARASGKTFLTLAEAITQKKVVVYETKTVNTLMIENLSDEEVFVQSGDIVKGGQQDRMLATDLILPGRSGKVSISAFCVEQGRWSKRGAETVTQFSSANDRAATKELKLAAARTRSQGEVWNEVSKAQAKLSANVGASVSAPVSASSLQLSLENERVRATTDEYVKALSGIVAKHPDAVGYAFAINGHVNSADVYSSPALFRKMWPGLLKASAVEAVAELKGGKAAASAGADDVRSFIEESESGAAADKDVSSRVQLRTRETQSNIVFETRDRAGKSAWVHRSYINKK
ncbi:MAG TPA: DUF6569 family protein [Pyrinomonadaceae bacterium]|nr:DUF6569 family protein [Pyrinomonadaceae bacterium]